MLTFFLPSESGFVSGTVEREVDGQFAPVAASVPAIDPEAYYNAVRGAPTVRVSPEGEKLDRVLRAIGRAE